MLRKEIQALLPARTQSPDETRQIGRSIAKAVEIGDVVAVYGNLGAGKTQFITGFCEALGVDPATIHSPTFTIVNEYESPIGPIYHFDVYRIERLIEFIDIGYEGYFTSGACSLVEWADRVEPLLPEDAIRIRIEHAGEDRRLIAYIGI